MRKATSAPVDEGSAQMDNDEPFGINFEELQNVFGTSPLYDYNDYYHKNNNNRRRKSWLSRRRRKQSKSRSAEQQRQTGEGASTSEQIYSPNIKRTPERMIQSVAVALSDCLPTFHAVIFK